MTDHKRGKVLTMSVQQQQGATNGDFESFEETARWIADTFSVIGWGLSVLFRGVTNIKEWENNTSQEVEVWKIDGGGRRDNYRIPPQQKLRADMWIPWADNPGQFPGHHATVKVGGQLLGCFWQSGNGLWFSLRDEYMGAPIPGVQGAGGNRRIIFGTDPQGRTAFAIGEF